MKKTILATLAIASMMSCSNEELLEAPAQQAITFGNTFVENAPATRAAYDGSYTTSSLTQFQVYGTITNTSDATGRVFKGEVVENKFGTWTLYGVTQYWIPGNTYNFWGIADGNVKGATSVDAPEELKYVPQTITVDASQQKDVLWATRTFENFQSPDGTVVEFNFHHLMAKAKFTVKNTIKTNSGYSYKVSNLTIKGVEKNGVYDITNKAWGVADTPATYDLPFGNAVTTGTDTGADADYIEFDGRKESNYERLLIPSNKKLNITFNCEIYKDHILIASEERTVTTTNTVNLEPGKAYNLIISLANPGEEITFDVNAVEEWDTDHDDNGTKNDETPIN